MFAVWAVVSSSSNDAFAQTLFVDATAQLGPQGCGPGMNTGCYSHWTLIVDLDNDEALDVVVANGGGYYTLGAAAPMAVLLNDGDGNFTDVAASSFDDFTGRVRQMAAGDVDGDGDVDLFLPDSYGNQDDALFINDGLSPPTFVDEGALRIGTSSRAGATRFGDIDDDGDLDLIVTDWGASPPSSAGTARVYFNDGAGFFTEFLNAIPSDTAAIGTGPIDLELTDIDNDFDLDLLVASRSGDSLLFENDGNGMFSNAQDKLPPQTGPYVYGPDACDVDGDGDLDLWLDNGATGLAEQLLLNDGDGTFVDVTSTRVTGNPGADDNRITCVDVDDDGDFDAVIASLSGQERVLWNDGNGFFVADGSVFPTVNDATLGMDLADLDDDGRLDAVTTQGEYGAFLNRLYVGTNTQAVDESAPKFRTLETSDDVPTTVRVVHFAISDRVTSDIGPRLRSVTVETEFDAPTSTTFMGGDLFRARLNLSDNASSWWRACATDHAGNTSCSAHVALPLDIVDGGSREDAGSHDAGTVDGGSDDAGAVDAGAVDAGTVDAGAVDAGTVDAGAVDAGADDAGVDDHDDGGIVDASDGGTIDSGCSCHTTSLSARDMNADHAGIIALAFVSILRRRRRR